jgi:hypothetical protein
MNQRRQDWAEILGASTAGQRWMLFALSILLMLSAFANLVMAIILTLNDIQRQQPADLVPALVALILWLVSTWLASNLVTEGAAGRERGRPGEGHRRPAERRLFADCGRPCGGARCQRGGPLVPVL